MNGYIKAVPKVDLTRRGFGQQVFTYHSPVERRLAMAAAYARVQSLRGRGSVIEWSDGRLTALSLCGFRGLSPRDLEPAPNERAVSITAGYTLYDETEETDE